MSIKSKMNLWIIYHRMLSCYEVIDVVAWCWRRQRRRFFFSLNETSKRKYLIECSTFWRVIGTQTKWKEKRKKEKAPSKLLENRCWVNEGTSACFSHILYTLSWIYTQKEKFRFIFSVFHIDLIMGLECWNRLSN